MDTVYQLPDQTTLLSALSSAMPDDYAQQYMYDFVAAQMSGKTLVRAGIALGLNMAFYSAVKKRELLPIVLATLMMSEDDFVDAIIAVSQEISDGR